MPWGCCTTGTVRQKPILLCNTSESHRFLLSGILAIHNQLYTIHCRSTLSGSEHRLFWIQLFLFFRLFLWVSLWRGVGRTYTFSGTLSIWPYPVRYVLGWIWTGIIDRWLWNLILGGRLLSPVCYLSALFATSTSPIAWKSTRAPPNFPPILTNSQGFTLGLHRTNIYFPLWDTPRRNQPNRKAVARVQLSVEVQAKA